FRLFFIPLPPPPTSTLFPYTTLFRSIGDQLLKKRFPLGAVIPVGRRQSPRAPALGGAPPRSAGCAGRRARRTTVELPSNGIRARSEEHTSELQSRFDLVCRLLLEKKK